MKEFTKEYTKEYVYELIEWFEAQTNIPESIYIDQATYVPDLKKTIFILCDVAKDVYENHHMWGSIVLLEKIKKLLEQNQ